MIAKMLPALLCGALVAQGPVRQDDREALVRKTVDFNILLTPEQKFALAKRLLDKEPFLKSAEASQGKRTMGHFFTMKEYGLLAGNPGLGYYTAPEAFSWPSEAREVEFQAPRATDASTARIRPEAWDRAMAFVAQKRGLLLVGKGQGKVRITGAVVRYDASGKYPQVTVELRITDSKGVQILHRKTETRPTAGDAVGALLDVAVGFARKFGEGGAHGAP